MHIASETLDDAMLELYPRLFAADGLIEGSRNAFRELVGVLLEIARPRARLSRTETRGRPFSALGELLWYLTRDNRLDFIRPYIPRYAGERADGVTVHGSYGPRLFGQRGHDQIANVIELLRRRSATKRAVIQVFDVTSSSLVAAFRPTRSSMVAFQALEALPKVQVPEGGASMERQQSTNCSVGDRDHTEARRGGFDLRGELVAATVPACSDRPGNTLA